METPVPSATAPDTPATIAPPAAAKKPEAVEKIPRTWVGWCWAAAKGVFKAWIFACLMLYLLQEWIIFPGPSTPADRPYPFERPFKETTLSVDGAELAAVHFPLKGSRGTVLFFHGNGQVLEQLEYVAMMFEPHGMDVFAFDYRGYGKSTGYIRGEAKLHSDALAAYKYVTETLRRPPERVFLYGLSIGTGMAVRLAAEQPAGGVLLEAPYYSLVDMAARRHPWLPGFLLKYPLRNDLYIGKIACPVTLFHGKRDFMIPFDSSERLLPLVTAPKKLVAFPNGGHDDLTQQPEYRPALAELFKDWPKE